jgi:putative SOS response-associated peptidase YedK
MRVSHTRADALGPGASMVEQASQRAAGGHLQRARGERPDQAVLPRRVQTHPLPHPALGYYEWQSAPGGKQPWYFTAADGSPLLTAAGLWDEWKDRATGEQLKSCTVIITEPNDFVAEVHDRMPVLLRMTQR